MTSTTSERMPARTTPPAPRAAQGYTIQASEAAFWSTLGSRFTTPELMWPLCIPVYDAMEDQDTQVASVLRAMMLPILRTTWRMDGTGCNDAVTAFCAADFGLPVVGKGNVTPPIGRNRFSWASHNAWALKAKLKYGNGVFEEDMALDPASGYLHLVGLGYRYPQSIVKRVVNSDGSLAYVEQANGAGQAIRLDGSRLVVYVNEQEPGNWIGRSVFRAAYKNWLLKDRFLWVQTTSAERNGMGVPDYEGAPGETDLGPGEDIARQLRAGDDAGVARPNGSKLQLLGVTGTLPDTAGPIGYHDESIAKAMLAHFLNLGSKSGSGSYALGAVQGDFFTQGLQAEAGDQAETGSLAVRDLVTANWGEDEPAPRIVFDEIGSNTDSLIQSIAILVQSGVLTADAYLEDYLRTTLGLPGLSALTPHMPPPKLEAGDTP